MLLKGCLLLLLLPAVLGQYEYEEPLLYDTFPEDFAWGVATSAFQVVWCIGKNLKFGFSPGQFCARSKGVGTQMAKD